MMQKINYSLGKFVKRLIDIIFSFVAIILLLPLFFVIYILISLDGGNVLFGNKRVGREGRKFSCLKFRTMFPNSEKILHEFLESDAEANSIWQTHRKIKNDPRITNIGIFLRKSSLDELPQLINVLKGEMSIVGPRPILPEEIKFFDAQQLKSYYSVKPGITGLWQVSGRNNISFKGRVDLDTKYINNWSIRNDIAIMLKTVAVVIKRKGAY